MLVNRPAVRIAWGGTAAVLAYAVVAAIQILVWNPHAAIPGRSLAQIHADVTAAGESPGIVGTLVILGAGVALAVSVLVVSCRRDEVRTSSVIACYLAMLTLGAPASFFASFGPGMSLADTYAISGGDHSGGALPLYAVSALAALALLAAAVLRAVRRTRGPQVHS